MTARLRASAARLVQHFGEGATATLRRRHSLISLKAVPTSLLLHGNHAVGATAVSLRAANLDGMIVPGIRLTIAGNQYEVTAEKRVVSNVLAAVPIATPLAAGAADGATVAIEEYRDYTATVLFGRRREALDDDVRGGEQDVLLAAEGAPTTPRSDDQLVTGGVPGELVAVRPIQPGGTLIGWRLRRSGRAA